MAKTKISEYSTTNSANTDINSININEGCAPSGINNAIRELMVHLKNFITGASSDPLTVGGAFVASSTAAVSGAATLSGGATLSGTNTFSGANIISGNINSSGTNTFSGNQVFSGNVSLSNALGVASGGTGTTTLTGVVIGNGTSAFTTKTNPSGAFVGTSDTQTLTNKTFTGFTQTVFTITDGSSVDLNPANGTIQVWTLGANRSPTANSFAAGQSMTLMVDDGTARTITWPSVTWVGGVAPTLATSGYTVVVLWKVSTTLYGALVGSVA